MLNYFQAKKQFECGLVLGIVWLWKFSDFDNRRSPFKCYLCVGLFQNDSIVLFAIIPLQCQFKITAVKKCRLLEMSHHSWFTPGGVQGTSGMANNSTARGQSKDGLACTRMSKTMARAS